MWFRRNKATETDVLIVGSGGAGLAAALAASHGGAEVIVVEKATKAGGTTAVSGGVIWIPNNHHMKAAGISDSRDEARNYMLRLADGRSSEALIDTYLDESPAMLRFIEEVTPLKFAALPRYPDYHPEFDGAKSGGRSLDPGLFDTNLLGPWKDKLRKSPIFGMTAMSVTEATDWGVFSKPLSLPFKELGKRYAKGLVCYGGALVGGLLKAILDRGIEPRLGVAGKELIIDDGKVVGLRTAEGDFIATKGVILASGGFEWNRQLVAQFLGGPLTHPNSPPTNEGDGLKMAMSAGADLGNMSEAWWAPSVVIPGEEYDGKQLNRGDFCIRSLPHSVIVNRDGERFVNEAQNYNDLMKPFFAVDPVRYERRNLPAYLIFDQAYVEKYALLTAVPGMPVPEFIAREDTLEALATRFKINATRFIQTVTRFNSFAERGVDDDFGRGASLYDHFYGDPENRPNPNLGTVAKPPFYALEVHLGAIGTKGGAKTNERAQVLHVNGQPIPGLYAAGNVMAGVMGPGYPGAGSTIGAAMTFGYLAGRDATRR
jgi:succinate dehydrogenase/fumarate reductase flavoprotein subunit